MGWEFRTFPCTKQEIIDECLKSVALELVTKSLQGNELWVVWQRKDGSRYIVVYLLASKKGCWGFKEISEAEGPLYHKCPLSFFALVPVANKEWRERVIAHHTKKLNNNKCVNNIAVGKVVALDVDSNMYSVKRIKPKLLGVSLQDGKTYRLIKSRIVCVLDKEPVRYYFG